MIRRKVRLKFVENKNSVAHYSKAVIHNGIVYVSGQLPILLGSKTPPETIEKQTELVLQKLQSVLEEAGSGINRILCTTIFVSDVKYWSKVNEVYAKFFGNHKPARTIVPTNTLHFGCLIEINAIASID